MAFTDNCSLFGAIDEDGINRVVRHFMRQRPSLFNYCTAYIRDHLDLMCEKIDVHPWVIARQNPIVTVEDPLPIIGTDGSLGLNFCFQLTKAEIDFHPGNVFTLPPQLGPPLKPQRFAFHVRVCGGLACASRDFLDKYRTPALIPEREVRKLEVRSLQPAKTISVSPVRTTNFQSVDCNSSQQVGYSPQAAAYPQSTGYSVREAREVKDKEPVLAPPPTAIPFDKLDCFCLDLYAVCHFEITGSVGNQRLVGKLDGLEIVDIQPEGLENSIECYMKLLIQMVILPKVSVALDKIVFEILDGAASITILPTPISPAVPFNPAVEDNKLKVFINVEAS